MFHESSDGLRVVVVDHGETCTGLADPMQGYARIVDIGTIRQEEVRAALDLRGVRSVVTHHRCPASTCGERLGKDIDVHVRAS